MVVVVREAAEVLSRRRITLAAALYLCNVVLLPQALYRLKLSHPDSDGSDADEQTRPVVHGNDALGAQHAVAIAALEQELRRRKAAEKERRAVGRARREAAGVGMR